MNLYRVCVALLAHLEEMSLGRLEDVRLWEGKNLEVVIVYFRVWERPWKGTVCLQRLTGIAVQSCPLSLCSLLFKKTNFAAYWVNKFFWFDDNQFNVIYLS